MRTTRQAFIQAYANLAADVRKEIIVVIDDEPYTWNAAYVEINNDTKKGQQILQQLEELDIL